MIRKLVQREVRREFRSGGYTDLALAGLDARVSGSDANALVAGSVEIAAGIWARTLAAARVTGTGALTARVRHRIGRDLIRCGESVHLIVTDPLGLEPAFDWDVREDWRYRLSLPEPTGNTRVVTAPRDAVAHFVWAADPREPWRGVGPLQSATALGKLAGRVESKLAEDLMTPIAHLVPIPTDGGDAALASLRADIGGAKGAAVLVEATTGGWDEGRQQAGTRADWRAQRLGPEVPETLTKLYQAVQASVAAACGIPASLAGRDADGTQLREDYRRFIMASVEPVADMVAEIASVALETDVQFSFQHLWAHDLAGRAKSFQALVSGGMPVEKAVQVAGLMVSE